MSTVKLVGNIIWTYHIIVLNRWSRSGVGIFLGIRRTLRDRMLQNSLEDVVRCIAIERTTHIRVRIS
jgi:hypothetical protein